jgi:isoquinoline 1-oxidoreductase beta subunit
VRRREFLERSAAGAALTLGVTLTGCKTEALPDAGGASFAPDAWIRIEADGIVRVMVDRSEMGQGVSTALPMLVAEELDADWEKVRFEFAPANAAYKNPLSFGQVTGGSTSVMAAWTPLRTGGARARAMLVSAAAASWGVAEGECRTAKGEVIHEASGRRLGYGELAARAAVVPAPVEVSLKDPKTFTLIGKAVPRKDTARMVTGAVRWGRRNARGVKTALIARCPVFDGRLTIRRIAGSSGARGARRRAIDSGVAVVDILGAFRGREALTWSGTKAASPRFRAT